MSFPVAHASADQLVAVARETSQGVWVAPTMAVPVARLTARDVFGWGDDGAVRGSAPGLYGRGQGPAWSEVEWAGPWLSDVGGHLLCNLLGDLATSGSSAPYTHTISTLNSGTGQPPSLTVADRQGTPANATKTRTFPGVCLSELTLTGGTQVETVGYTARGVGYPSTLANTTALPAPAGLAPFAGWRLQVGVGGAASGATLIPVDRLAVSIRRVTQVVHASTGGQAPRDIVRGDLSVTGSVLFPAVADETLLAPLLYNTQPRLQVLFSNGLAGTSAQSLTLDALHAAWSTAALDRSSDAVGYTATFATVANTTNAGTSGGFSPVKATLVNATPPGVY